MKSDHERVRIKNRKCRAPVPVSRLSHRTGIDQIMMILSKPPIAEFRLSHSAIRRTKSIAGLLIQGEASLQMRMSEKGKGHGECHQGFERVAERDYVIV